MRPARMQTLDAAQAPQHQPRAPQRQRADAAQQLTGGQRPGVRRRPDRRALTAVGGPDQLVRHERPQAPGEEAHQPPRALARVRVRPDADRVVVERAGEHVGERAGVGGRGETDHAADRSLPTAMRLTDQVRSHAERIAASARSVSVDADALGGLDPGPPPTLDAERHYLEGSEADVASYLLVLDTINFGSGWFPTLRKRPGCSGYFTIAWGLTDRFRAHGPWTNAQLRTMRTEEVAAVLGQSPDHELIALFAQALRQLGAFLDERSALDLVRDAGGSAERTAEL